MPVRLLPQEVSSKIAAGEVIERPASVVKELVENSLDAGSTEIVVEIRSGGVEHIRVADNGSGIAGDDAELAFQRFATSKLQDVDDLESISTLGFRGEALPSIAAVADVELVTRTADEPTGTRVTIRNGSVEGTQPAGTSTGTTISARHLFSDFPARRKFLRTPASEASRVQTMVTRYALAYPAVRFRLTNDKSEAFVSSGSGDLREVIANVYSPRYAEQMLKLVSGREPDPAQPSATGMIGAPALTRANRSHISIFVNGRWVENRMLTYALQEAYHGFLMERRYPVAVVDLHVPYESVDVNVHPSKTEVRFRRDGPAFAALQEAVRHTLTSHAPVPEVTRAPVGEPIGTPTRIDAAAFWPTNHLQRQTSAPGHHSAGPKQTPQPAEPSASAAPLHQATPLEKELPALRALGQIQKTYIAAEGPDGLFLIDQHAAHERILFERVTAEAQAGPRDVQNLLEPVTVEVDPEQGEVAERQADLLVHHGFRIEHFGGQTYLVRGVPAVLSDGDPGQALLDVLDLMAEGGGFDSWEDRAAYSIACHGAIRAGKSLTHQEMSALTRQLEECQQPHTCPHGRPTMIHLTSSRLEREFGRT